MSEIPKIIKLKNCAVTNNSIIFCKGKVLRESCIDDVRFKLFDTLRFRIKYFFTIFSFSKKQYVMIADEWTKNYYHWTFEALSRLIRLQKEFGEVVLLLPKAYLEIDFIKKSLNALGFDKRNIKLIPKQTKVWVRNLAFIPTCKSLNAKSYYDEYLRIEKIAKAMLKVFKKESVFGKRIYISRNAPNLKVFRRVVNEDSLVKMLEKYDFKTVYLENYSFEDQISICCEANIVVTPHGAGIANIIFFDDPSKSKLIEIANEKWEKTCYSYLCEKLGIDYSRLDAKQASEGFFKLADISVDVDALEKLLISKLK